MAVTSAILVIFLAILMLCAVQGYAQKQTNMTFYFHDIVVGKNQSVVNALPPAKGFTTGFGSLSVMDDPLTVGPELESGRIGSASGIYVASGQQSLRLLMAMVLVFESGEYNGSSLSVLASNPVLQNPREFPIVGGTGVFRLAQGYILANTQSLESNGNAVVRYDATVFHLGLGMNGFCSKITET